MGRGKPWWRLTSCCPMDPWLVALRTLDLIGKKEWGYTFCGLVGYKEDLDTCLSNLPLWEYQRETNNGRRWENLPRDPFNRSISGNESCGCDSLMYEFSRETFKVGVALNCTCNTTVETHNCTAVTGFMYSRLWGTETTSNFTVFDCRIRRDSDYCATGEGGMSYHELTRFLDVQDTVRTFSNPVSLESEEESLKDQVFKRSGRKRRGAKPRQKMPTKCLYCFPDRPDSSQTHFNWTLFTTRGSNPLGRVMQIQRSAWNSVRHSNGFRELFLTTPNLNNSGVRNWLKTNGAEWEKNNLGLYYDQT